MKIPSFLVRFLHARAMSIMASRLPDFIIQPHGIEYVRRWWVIRRNFYMNIYLHHFLHSDEDRALHDHPWKNCSILLNGSYLEHTTEGVFERHEGHIYFRNATTSHRIELHCGPVTTLFMTGPWEREWGFWCASGWRSWKIFCDQSDHGKIGRGCE